MVDVNESGRVKGRASIQLKLTDIVRKNATRPCHFHEDVFRAVAEPTKKRDAAVIGGGVGLGAAIGAIAGGGKGERPLEPQWVWCGTGTVLADER